MAYRIGIFDPAFKEKGHFIPFNSYIAQLAESVDIRIVFFDATGIMRQRYTDLPLSQAPEFIDSAPPRPRLFPGRIGSIFGRYLSWRQLFRQARAAHLDLLLITAEARGPLMYFFRPGMPYGVFLLYPYSYFTDPGRSSFIARIYAFFFKRFIARAAVRFSTSEPPILEDIRRILNMPDIAWIPNMPITADTERDRKHRTDFLTLGTISRSKSHAFAIQAFADANLPYRYHIAGAVLDETGATVQTMVEGLAATHPNISGEFSYMDEERYASLLSSADFAIFPYDFTRGKISSQVMHDCFSHNLPFIAPDIEPFAWYVRTYGIGLLYSEGDAASFVAAISDAYQRGPESFKSGFAALRAKHSLQAIKESFSRILAPLLSP